jgi:ferredoxin
MTIRQLKPVRVIAEILFFLPAVFLFLDFTGAVPAWLWRKYATLQIVPALLALTVSAGTAIWGVLLVTLLTIVFGRVYCSSLCPLGTLQDMISRLNRSRNSRRRFVYARPNYLLHYGLLVATLGGVLGGSVVLLNLLEPFSNFGRMTATLARPLAVVLTNTVVHLLEQFSIYALPPVAAHPIVLPVLAGALLCFSVLFWMSYHHGRLFCNSLCPAGAVLGLISRFSIFRVAFDDDACRDCGLCEKMCKARCIDADTHVIDAAACVLCLDCFEACPTEGVRIERHLPWNREPSTSIAKDRREFIQNFIKGAAVIAFAPQDSVKNVAGVGASRTTQPISPPGSGGIAQFTSMCTSCHVCVDTCPTHVLIPGFFDYGIEGIFQPRMEYSVGACTYECTLCGEVCPTGAILPLPLETKKLVQIGKATFVKDDCVVAVKKTDCGACAEHCPTKAVHMVPYEGKLVIPEVTQELCIGCGACEHPCPTTPNKAIYVQSNPLHATARKPEVKKAEPAVHLDQGFPF